MRIIATTTRLVLREFAHEDAPFILELVNDDGWLRFIGDRGVRSVGDARGYLDKGPITSYGTNGFGLYLVARRDDDTRLGMCGLVRRDTLDHPDLGYAFLPAFRGMGYATEAGAAMLDHAWSTLALSRVLAITNPENAGSIRVLERLGFALERQISVRDGEPDVNLYAVSRPQ